MTTRRRGWFIGLGVSALSLVGIGIFFLLVFSWGWFIPLLEARASAALGRPITIAGLRLHPGRVTMATLTGVRIGNPPGFEAQSPFAEIESVELGLNLLASLRSGRAHITSLAVDGAAVEAVTLEDGRNNHSFDILFVTAEPELARQAIGMVTLRRSRLHLVHKPLAADFAVTFETRDAADGTAGIAAEAQGTYAGAPLTARFTGGSILAIGDAATPWPVTLELLNGTTRGSLTGTVRNLLALDGADLRLELAGPDMRFLRPLTGVPIPSTPPFRVAGRLAYGEGRIRFTEMQGQVGQSDLGGTVTMDPRGAIPDITADLIARHVDLADLAGFIGGNPGRGTPIRPDSPSTGRVLPNTPVNLPLFRAANVHARLRAARIIGEDAPLDTLDVTLELINGVVTLKPLRGGVGRGALVITGTLTPREQGDLHAVGEVQFQGIDIARVMQALGGRGGGALEGRGRIDAVGRSTAELLARGNGALALRLAGGDLSAFAVDLAGLRLGNAIFSAFGLPSRTQLECFVADFGLAAGILTTRAMLLETTDALILGTGTIRLDREEFDMRLRSQAKRFTVGSLPTSLALTGRLSDPSVAPVLVQDRGGDGVSDLLDLALAPFSLLPVIELGIGDDPRCRDALRRTRRPGAAPPPR
ncbi:AsmA family protein [Sediminicoccus sp. KRV36]|uniref:AsmA family protein n=1 Tax=Sediminicoccus sp. KRV36 TaxID=3133721 RepID=UPI0020105148|nr:AsmA family protein [Sediminicoccus rosea]UPY34931.1 AsmA family protein [Sediminicoccus rosea]